MEARMESGIDVITMRVLLQLPRITSIKSPVRDAAVTASLTTCRIAALTKID
jgi:hypothetical protein